MGARTRARAVDAPDRTAGLRFVVLLRGVNVGKAKRVPMAAFREILESLACTDVRSLLNSGNAAFTAAGRAPAVHAVAIAHALHEHLGVDVEVIVKSQREFAAAATECPFVPPEAELERVLVAFAQDAAPLQRLAALRALLQPAEQFRVGRHAAYLHCAGGIRESRAAKALLGKAGLGVTTRNLATVGKLRELLAAAI